MTDSSPRDLDQLASDLVDGLLPPAQAARARREPEIAARVARLEQLRAALRSVPPPESSHMSRAIGAAVAAAQADTNPTRVGLRAVLPSRSAVPPPARPTSRPWLAAAAALLVAGVVTAGLIAGLTSGGGGNDDQAADMSQETADEPMASEPNQSGDTDDAGSASDDGAEHGGPSVEGADGPDDLGAVASSDELVAVVGQRVAGLTPDSTAPPSGIDREGQAEATTSSSSAGVSGGSCPGLQDAGDPDRGTLVYVANATLDGSPVRVHVYEQGGQTRLVATNPGCVDVVDVPL